MSKRFGRNQRRRMREELAATQAQAEKIQTLAMMQEEHANRMAEEVADIRALLHEFADRVGRHAIAADIPPPYESDFLERRGNFRMEVERQMPSLTEYLRMRDGRATTAAIQVEVMSMLDVEAVASVMRHEMHCRVNFDDHAIGYAISATALRNMTAREIERRIAPEIARLLVSELKVRK